MPRTSSPKSAVELFAHGMAGPSGRSQTPQRSCEKIDRLCHSERSEESAFFCFEADTSRCFASLSMTSHFFTASELSLRRPALTGLAKKLDLSVSEALDLLKERGIEAPIGLDDYLKGFEVFDQAK